MYINLFIFFLILIQKKIKKKLLDQVKVIATVITYYSYCVFVFKVPFPTKKVNKMSTPFFNELEPV